MSRDTQIAGGRRRVSEGGGEPTDGQAQDVDQVLGSSVPQDGALDIQFRGADQASPPDGDSPSTTQDRDCFDSFTFVVDRSDLKIRVKIVDPYEKHGERQLVEFKFEYTPGRLKPVFLRTLLGSSAASLSIDDVVLSRGQTAMVNRFQSGMFLEIDSKNPNLSSVPFAKLYIPYKYGDEAYVNMPEAGNPIQNHWRGLKESIHQQLRIGQIIGRASFQEAKS